MIPKRLGLKFQFTRRLRAAISSITSLADLPSDISIHATHTGRDAYIIVVSTFSCRFQFTRPIRAAITQADNIDPAELFQFTRPIRAAIKGTVGTRLRFQISIHATHTGRDWQNRLTLQTIKISIHATHTGRDQISDVFEPNLVYFNSRDPYGPRFPPGGSGRSSAPFQFTRPIRAAIELILRFCVYGRTISIHATHTGRDLFRPCVICVWDISIHATHTGRDFASNSPRSNLTEISIHATHTGRDPLKPLYRH